MVNGEQRICKFQGFSTSSILKLKMYAFLTTKKSWYLPRYTYIYIYICKSKYKRYHKNYPDFDGTHSFWHLWTLSGWQIKQIRIAFIVLNDSFCTVWQRFVELCEIRKSFKQIVIAPVVGDP